MRRNIVKNLMVKMIVKLARSKIIPHGIKKFFSELLTVTSMWFPNNKIRLFLNRIKGIKIGKNCIIELGCFLDDSKPHLITIMDNVTLAPCVKIFAHTPISRIERDLKGLGSPYPEATGKVIIEDNVYIGAGSIILPNVRIGKNSIVGAGSVVTKNVEENSVVVGIPAKRINRVKET